MSVFNDVDSLLLLNDVYDSLIFSIFFFNLFGFLTFLTASFASFVILNSGGILMNNFVAVLAVGYIGLTIFVSFTFVCVVVNPLIEYLRYRVLLNHLILHQFILFKRLSFS